MVVDWVSSAPPGTSMVMFSDTAPKECFPHFCLNDSFVTNITAVDVGTSAEMANEKANYSMHSAVMTGLKCGATHFYQVGSPEMPPTLAPTKGFSPAISFTALCDKGFDGRPPIWAA